MKSHTKLDPSVAQYFSLGDSPPKETLQQMSALGYVHGKHGHRLAARYAGVYAKPKQGQWFLSGAIINAYLARDDMNAVYPIAELVVVHSQMVEQTEMLAIIRPDAVEDHVYPGLMRPGDVIEFVDGYQNYLVVESTEDPATCVTIDNFNVGVVWRVSGRNSRGLPTWFYCGALSRHKLVQRP